MTNFLSRLVSPTALLYVYVTLRWVADGIYLAREIKPPAAFTFLGFCGMIWILGWWLLTDSRKRGIAWVYDIGFFLYIAWPFVMPYYLFKTRGARALLPILAFLITGIAAEGVGMALSLLLAPSFGVR